MKFINNVRDRFSLRNYDQRQPEREKIEYVLECARLAPSAVNRQPWQLIIAQSAEAREKLFACYPREWFRTAPVIIAVCVNNDEAWTRPSDGKNHADIDGSIIAQQICRKDSFFHNMRAILSVYNAINNQFAILGHVWLMSVYGVFRFVFILLT